MKNLIIFIVEGNTEEENLKFKKLSNQPQSFNFRNNILKYYNFAFKLNLIFRLNII